MRHKATRQEITRISKYNNWCQPKEQYGLQTLADKSEKQNLNIIYSPSQTTTQPPSLLAHSAGRRYLTGTKLKPPLYTLLSLEFSDSDQKKTWFTQHGKLD